MRLRLDLAYDGTAYSGWQIQQKPLPPPTIQGALEAAFFKLTGSHVVVTASGRTDAGVHAWQQVAHVDVDRGLPNWQKSLNAVLPKDIRVLAVREVPASFHARRDAVAKTYVYQFWQGADLPPLLFGQSWQCGPLNQSLLLEAARQLVGEHDFATFQNAGTPVRSTIRRIFAISLLEKSESLYYPDQPGQLLLMITASGFLRQMMRNMAGMFVRVGRQEIDPACVREFLNRRDRRGLPAPAAPARGLGLLRVWYEPGRLHEFLAASLNHCATVIDPSLSGQLPGETESSVVP